MTSLSAKTVQVDETGTARGAAPPAPRAPRTGREGAPRITSRKRPVPAAHLSFMEKSSTSPRGADPDHLRVLATHVHEHPRPAGAGERAAGMAGDLGERPGARDALAAVPGGSDRKVAAGRRAHLRRAPLHLPLDPGIGRLHPAGEERPGGVDGHDLAGGRADVHADGRRGAHAKLSMKAASRFDASSLAQDRGSLWSASSSSVAARTPRRAGPSGPSGRSSTACRSGRCAGPRRPPRTPAPGGPSAGACSGDCGSA